MEREVVVGVSVRVEKKLETGIGVVAAREIMVDEEGGADREVGEKWTEDIEGEGWERTSENRRRGAGVVLCTWSRAVRLVRPESYIN